MLIVSEAKLIIDDGAVARNAGDISMDLNVFKLRDAIIVFNALIIVIGLWYWMIKKCLLDGN